jgi:L-fuculose-phosphate aldolase
MQITDTIRETRQLIVEYGAELYQRRLTDVTGGNISARIGDIVLMTPTLAGRKFHWKLRPEQILILDPNGNKLEGDGEISSEGKTHLTLLQRYYPDGTAVIHTHARNMLVFCAAEKPMPPVLNAAMKFGEIQQVADAPSGTQQLADNIADAMRDQIDRVRKQAAAVMAPRHGLFVLAKDLPSAFDATERLDCNAYCILMGRSLFDASVAKVIGYVDQE